MCRVRKSKMSGLTNVWQQGLFTIWCKLWSLLNENMKSDTRSREAKSTDLCKCRYCALVHTVLRDGSACVRAKYSLCRSFSRRKSHAERTWILTGSTHTSSGSPPTCCISREHGTIHYTSRTPFRLEQFGLLWKYICMVSWNLDIKEKENTCSI